MSFKIHFAEHWPNLVPALGSAAFIMLLIAHQTHSATLSPAGPWPRGGHASTAHQAAQLSKYLVGSGLSSLPIWLSMETHSEN